MTGEIAARLRARGLDLPPPPQPVATYVGFTVTGNLVHLAGVGPTWGKDVRYQGKVGHTVSVQDGHAAAELTALNLLSLAQVACGGNLDRVERWVRILTLVNAGPDFTDAHLVANGVTDLLRDLYGAEKVPSRSVTTSPSLPMDISVEADAVFIIG